MGRPRKQIVGAEQASGDESAQDIGQPSLHDLLDAAIKTADPRAHAAVEAVRLAYLDLLARAAGVAAHLPSEILTRIEEL